MASRGNDRDSSDEASDAQCTTCKGQNKIVESEKYCVDCQDYYCSSCLKMHATLPALEGHKLLDKKDGQSGKLLPMPTERCNRHNFKAVDMFCENHGVVGCSTCIAVDHRDCKDVCYIPEYIESKHNVIPEIQQRMDSVEKKLKHFLKVFNDESNALNSNKDTEIETIERLGEELENKIKEATEQAIIKVKDKYETLRGKIDGNIANITMKLESAETIKDLILSSVENKPQTFVTAKLHEGKIAETEAACLDIERIKLGKRINFSQNKDNYLINNDTFIIGHVAIIPHNFVPKDLVNVKLCTDTKCCTIWGSNVLPDGSVVFADLSNSNVKLLNDKTLTVADHYKFSSQPTDVCYIEKGEICVCLPSEHKIKMFRVTQRKLLPTYEFKLNFYCKGVSYLDNKLYITDGVKNIHEVSMEGQILRTISPVFEENVNCTSLYYICASKHNKNIFVSDSNNTGSKGIICIENDGTFLNTVSDEVQWPWDLSDAGNGEIFACGYSSKNVILLNEMGEYVRTVINEGLSGPLSICYDCVRARLYVSSAYRDEIQVFEAE